MDIIYWSVDDIDDGELKCGFFAMSEERRLACMRYKNDSDKKLCIAADMLAREALSALGGIPTERLVFTADKNGKPHVANGELFFSMSHSGKYVAVAVSDKGDVGVDVECIRPVAPSVMRLFCSDSDRMFITDGLSEDRLTNVNGKLTDSAVLERFFRVWCFKEAFFKKTGEGIGKHASSVSYSDFSKAEIILPDGIICAVE